MCQIKYKGKYFYNQTLIPIELIALAIRKRCLPVLQLWIFLKTKYGFVIANFDAQKDKISAESQILDRRTLNKMIKLLNNKFWISIDKNGTLFLRSYEFVAANHDIKLSPGALLFPPHDINNFRGWCGAALFTKAYNQIKYLRSQHRNNSSRSLQGAGLPQVSCGYVAKLFKISINKVKYLKVNAINAGYLKSFKNSIIIGSAKSGRI